VALATGQHLGARVCDTLVPPSGPTGEEGVGLAGFLFRLETEDGKPAEPAMLNAAIPNWRVGDTIPLGKRALVVIGNRDDDGDQPPVLIVEEA
jgi:hypothetical protein